MNAAVDWSEASLFSLELVVEKLYLPHVVCRFPAVAFRLLDFPTILIKHVEDDLANRIKRKISLDKYYEIPDQFGELKDKHGNYMIKKGKSCLFKIGLKTFREHMSNTPLYVMMLDAFPEVPKLVANTTISLEKLMDNICDAIKKTGNGVPTVDGDKGLFKLYSLMGKEVGYVVVGYRLISLGPSLIPHIADTHLINGERKLKSPSETEVLVHSEDALLQTREMGSMTDVLKYDTSLQTAEVENKGTHMEFPLKDNMNDTREMAINTAPDMAIAFTQTERTVYPSNKLKKNRKISENYDGQVFTTDLFCPPPLFYNSNAQPQYKKVLPYKEYTSDSETISLSDDLTIEDISSDDEDKITEYETRIPNKETKSQNDPKTLNHPKFTVLKRGPRDQAHTVTEPDTFPLLSALISELTKLQNPQLQNICHQYHEHTKKITQPSPAVNVMSSKSPKVGILNKAPCTAQPAGKNNVSDQSKQMNAQVIKPIPDSEQLVEGDKLDHYHGRQSHKHCAHPHPGVPKNKGWIRNVPQSSIKKSKLTFRMTNAHRLRLEKSNPKWLKSVEAEKGALEVGKKIHVQGQNTKEEEEQFNETHLSDAFTEVRNHTDDDVMEIEKDREKSQTKLLSKKNVPSPMKHSPKRNEKGHKISQIESPSPKFATKKSTSKITQGKQKFKHTTNNKHPLTENYKMKGRSEKFPQNEKKHNQIIGTDEVSEAHSSVSARSIEVRVPSADQVYDDSDWESSQNADEEEELKPSLPRPSAFPGFVDGNISMPDSIGGKPNESLNVSADTGDQPLESTRYSKDYQAETRDSKMSTDDYTRRTFHSTDELELQQLMSDAEKYDSDYDVSQRSSHRSRSVNQSAGERSFTKASVVSSQKFQIRNPVVSDSSPVPATRRSQVRLDLERATLVETPQSHIQTSRASPERPTPTPRAPKMKKPYEKTHLPSLHTDSLSSYAPSDPENVTFSQSYSDDFNLSDSESVLDMLSSNEAKRPRFIPSTKLGYTIG